MDFRKPGISPCNWSISRLMRLRFLGASSSSSLGCASTGGGATASGAAVAAAAAVPFDGPSPPIAAISAEARFWVVGASPSDGPTHPRELVKLGRNVLNGAIPPKIVSTGPVKENIVTGKDVDLYELPTPQWNRTDGGRYIATYAGCVTKNPDTHVMNVGVYRGMIGDKNHIPIYMYRAQHIGHHALAWQQKGAKEMPIAYVVGWEPSMDFCAGRIGLF